MPNPFVKLWKYLTASANQQIDQRADPKIQIAQAIEAEQNRHQSLANQAAAVLGNQRQLEMRLNRQLGEVEKLQSSARQALTLADQTRAKGDAAKASEYEQAAQAFATQLVSAETWLAVSGVCPAMTEEEEPISLSLEEFHIVHLS